MLFVRGFPLATTPALGFSTTGNETIRIEPILRKINVRKQMNNEHPLYDTLQADQGQPSILKGE